MQDFMYLFSSQAATIKVSASHGSQGLAHVGQSMCLSYRHREKVRLKKEYGQVTWTGLFMGKLDLMYK